MLMILECGSIEQLYYKNLTTQLESNLTPVLRIKFAIFGEETTCLRALTRVLSPFEDVGLVEGS